MNTFEIKQENGISQLYINGIYTPPLIYTLTYLPDDCDVFPWAEENIRNFKDAGINIVSFCADIYWDWKEDGVYTGERLQRCISHLVKANKDIKLLIRFDLSTPYWWLNSHPDELIQFYNQPLHNSGRYDVVLLHHCPDNEVKASFVSEIWQNDVCDVLKQLSKILKESPYIDNIIGIQIGYGTCGEWHMFGNPYGNPPYEADYSKPMLKFFRKFLKEKYKTDEALQKSWKQNDVTLETAQIATPQMRREFKENNKYLLPEYSMPALDSFKCFQLAGPCAISKFAGCLKKEWGNHLIVGTFYNYFYACGNVYSRFLEPEILLRNNDIDYFAAPSPYTANKISGNISFLRYLAESMRLNNKLFICEMDQGSVSCFHYKGIGDTYTCENQQEYNAIIKRNILENIVRGMGAWFFDHRHPKDLKRVKEKKGYWNTKESMETIRELFEFRKALPKLRPSFKASNDVLLVQDTETIYNIGQFEDIQNSFCQFDFHNALAKSGATCDYIYLHDIKKCDLSHYKCILFNGCDAMKSEYYNYVKNTVMSGGRTIAFIGKNGYILDNHTSIQNVYNLYGTEKIDEYGEIHNKDCTVIIYPKQPTDSGEFRKLFKKANARIYTDNNEVLAGQNGLLMIHCKETPVTHLHLPCGNFKIKNEKFSTKLFDIETGKQIL